MKEKVFNEKVWVPSLSPFKFSEKIDPRTGEKKFILQGLMLPFGKVSRNSVLYNPDSIKEKHKELVGRPLMYNHQVEGQELPLGHFVESWVEPEGWFYKADIDPNEKNVIRKLERGDLRHVSIQLIGGKVIERLDNDNRSYTEAYVSDIIEGSLVPAPGFLDTTAKFAEALGREDATTTTGKGAIPPAIIVKKKKESFREGTLAVEITKNLNTGEYPAGEELQAIISDLQSYLSSKGYEANISLAEGITTARPQAPIAEKEAIQLLYEVDEISAMI